MPQIWKILALASALWSVAGTGLAQVRNGDFRLYLDASLVNWSNLTERTEGAGTALETTTKALGVGVFGTGGVGLGYVVGPHLVPELYFSFQHADVEVDGRSRAHTREFEVRPALEIPLLPRARFVPYLMVAASVAKRVAGVGRDDRATVLLGLAMGAGFHGFLTPKASLDVGFTFRPLFVVRDDIEDTLPAGVDYSARTMTLLLNVGASFWL